MPTSTISAERSDEAVAALETYFPGVQIGSDRGNQLKFSMSASSLPQGLSFLDFTIGRADVDATEPYIIHRGLESRYESAHAHVLTVQSEVFLRQLENRGRRDPSDFRFTGIGPRTPEHGRYWDAVMLTVAQAVDTGAADNALIAGSLLDLIVTSSLACFTHTWDDEEAAGRSVLPATVRRARAFIDDNAHQPITLAQVAEAARMSVRGVQYAFLRDLEMTPTAYLRRVRMSRARAALLAASPFDGDTVAGIARSSGFGHPARFAAAYRTEYGENPSDTLKRNGSSERFSAD